MGTTALRSLLGHLAAQQIWGVLLLVTLKKVVARTGILDDFIGQQAVMLGLFNGHLNFDDGDTDGQVMVVAGNLCAGGKRVDSQPTAAPLRGDHRSPRHAATP